MKTTKMLKKNRSPIGLDSSWNLGLEPRSLQHWQSPHGPQTPLEPLLLPFEPVPAAAVRELRGLRVYGSL